MLLIGTCLVVLSLCFAHPYDEQAPIKCTGKHEHYECGGACDNVCETLHIQNQTNCPILNIKCNDKCYCDEGHARDDNNECIPVEDCKPSKCPGPNEHYSDCTHSCPPETCMSIVARYKCAEQTCEAGCKCDDGFLRADDGQDCIPINDCPQMGGGNN